MINIEELTIGEARQIAKAMNVEAHNGNTHFFVVGKNYFIRTVTMYYTGHLTAVTDNDLLLTDAAWIADTGRFSDALKSGEFSEVEPFIDPIIISRSGIIDATEWRHGLPKEKK